MSNVILDECKSQQERARVIQKKLLRFLEQGEAAGMVFDPSLKEKLKHAIDGGERLNVVLVGGFSEGKTSIAAAWLGCVHDDMKISQAESSNEVAIYRVDNELTLVDTPGLFGYKERYNANIQAAEKYKDITRKYVSEAHLVLYVMNSENPVKESHGEELQWLFRELDLLSRTVFVLSRFDSVADMEDEDEYLHSLSIKKNNVISRLRNVIGLTSDEEAALSIVAVSANPWGKGADYWFSNPEGFSRISKIPLLQDATLKKIRSEGGLERMAVKKGQSIIRDVLIPRIGEAEKKMREASEEVHKLERSGERAQKHMAKLISEMNQARASMKKFVVDHFADVILQVKGASLETISEVFEREIGSGGAVLDATIQDGLAKRSAAVDGELISIQASLREDVSVFNDYMFAAGRQGVDWIAKSGIINAGSIKAVRDMFFAGVKFKPWGMVNLAKNINAALPFIGVALEVWDSYSKVQKQQEFEDGKKIIISNLESQRDELRQKFEGENFIREFFPSFYTFDSELKSLNGEIEKKRRQQQAFAAWREEARVIEGEFRDLSE